MHPGREQPDQQHKPTDEREIVRGLPHHPPGQVEGDPQPLAGALGKLHRVRFERNFVLEMLRSAQLRFVRLDHQCEPQTGQSVVTAVRSST